jgi:hypothetical protein
VDNVESFKLESVAIEDDAELAEVGKRIERRERYLGKY